jgi:hypothetical protein
MSEKFIGLEDEITLRRAVRAVYKHEGWDGIFKCAGELARSLEIVCEVAKEIDDEEQQNKGS